MSDFWLYESNSEFDTELQKWRGFIESKRTELEGVENGLCDAILEVNKDNTIKCDNILGNKINNLNTGTTIRDKNILFKNYETIRGALKELYYQKFFKDGILICPYCGCNYIFDGNSLGTSTELDHYLNRDQFPQFAGNPYNIVPVCRNCNNKKSNESNIDEEDDILGFYPSTQFPISGLYLVNKLKSEDVKSNYPELFKACKIENRYIANRNQSKLQVLYEDCLSESCYYGTDLKKVLFKKNTASIKSIRSTPYANFDSQFYDWLLKNEGLEL